MGEGIWKAEIVLGSRIVIAGRIRTDDGQVLTSEDSERKPNYGERFEWLRHAETGLRGADADVAFVEQTVERRQPDREAGRLPEHTQGLYGGFENHVVDVLVASWGAVGGLNGLVQLVKLYKELKSLRGHKIKLVTPAGTTIEVSSEADLAKALEMARELESKAPKDAPKAP